MQRVKMIKDAMDTETAEASTKATSDNAQEVHTLISLAPISTVSQLLCREIGLFQCQFITTDCFLVLNTRSDQIVVAGCTRFDKPDDDGCRHYCGSGCHSR